MQAILDEERAKRGVIASLAAQAICSSRPKNYISHQAVVRAVSTHTLSLIDCHWGASIDPPIANSHIMEVASHVKKDEEKKIINPFYVKKEIVEAVIPDMLKDELITSTPIKSGRNQTHRYHLTKKAIGYLQNYDPEMAQKVASLLGLSAENVHSTEDSNPLLNLAKKYASSMCRKAEWER